MSELKININGELLLASKSGLSVNNRAYKFGDSLFEFMRVADGKILFPEDHYSRLVKGMKVLEYDVPGHWDQAFMKKEIAKLLPENGVNTGGRIRLTVFRKSEGLYTPTSNEIGYA